MLLGCEDVSGVERTDDQLCCVNRASIKGKFPILIYEQMKDDCPPDMITRATKTGFGDTQRLKHVECVHIVHPNTEQCIVVRTGLYKVCFIIWQKISCW